MRSGADANTIPSPPMIANAKAMKVQSGVVRSETHFVPVVAVG